MNFASVYMVKEIEIEDFDFVGLYSFCNVLMSMTLYGMYIWLSKNGEVLFAAIIN